MARFRILILIFACFLCLQKTWASVDEPLPAFQKIYVSAYEQNVLLSVMQNKKIDPLELLLASAPEMDQEKEKQFRAELDSFVQKMNRKKETSSDKVFLQNLFYKTHRKFLKEYKPYKNFYSMLDNGAYNCLSGTALYALLLNELDYSYRIIETDYHIFLMVKTAEGEEIMIESTDPLNGLLTEGGKIEQRIEAIREDVLRAEEEEQKSFHDFKLEVFREVDLQQLAGLQYFNLAAHLYNNRKLFSAKVALAKGRVLYQAERFDQFAKLLSALQ